MPTTVLTGIAKAILSTGALKPPPEALALVMPMTSPYMLNSAPPELPELMAQSVWMSFRCMLPEKLTSLSRALITPRVREKWSSPRGLPMATTSSPTAILSESPKTTGVMFLASTFKTAMSLLSS